MAGAGEVLLTPPLPLATPPPPGTPVRGEHEGRCLTLHKCISPCPNPPPPAAASRRWLLRLPVRFPGLAGARPGSCTLVPCTLMGTSPKCAPPRPVPRRDRCWSHRVPFRPPPPRRHSSRRVPHTSSHAGTRPRTPGHAHRPPPTHASPFLRRWVLDPPSAPQGYTLRWGWGQWELVPSSPASSSSPKQGPDPACFPPPPACIGCSFGLGQGEGCRA